MLLLRLAPALGAAAALCLPATALAAPPANDSRTTPTALGRLPSAVDGTTVDATRAPTDPPSGCPITGGPQVWYRFTAPADGRIAVRLQAAGKLDAAVDVYLSQRSQTRGLSCDVTDDKGAGAADFQAKAGQEYLVSVTQLANSVAGTFDLTVVAPQKPERPPGARLPKGGADGTLDRIGNVQDAYSVRLRQGRTYRLRLSGRSEEPCRISGALYSPDARDFGSGSVKQLGCDGEGYATFTPGDGEGGRYNVLLSADRGVRTLQGYHLEVAGAGADDTAPGRFLANRAATTNALNGARVDALDLYRFTVARRSDLTLRLGTGSGNGYDLLLLNEKGRRVQCACGDSGNVSLARQLAAGRYFVAIRARGRSAGGYRLIRATRLLTRTTTGFGDRRVGLGSSTPIGVRVRPKVSGPVTVIIQRFDPLSGWIFDRAVHTRARDGRASVGFVAPTVGRWRARATFDGTIGAGSSASGFAQTLVVARDPR